MMWNLKAKELKLRSRFSRGDKDQKENHGSLALQQEKRRKKSQTGKLIRQWMNRAEWKYCVQELIWGKRGGGGKRREDHPSWLGGSGPGFFSGMIGDHWHSLDTDQSSSVSVRHDWSKKMVVARAQNKICTSHPSESEVGGNLRYFLGLLICISALMMDKLDVNHS